MVMILPSNVGNKVINKTNRYKNLQKNPIIHFKINSIKFNTETKKNIYACN